MERDIEDYLGWLRDKRGKAAQTLSTYRRMLRRFAAAHSGRDLRLLDDEALQHYLSNRLGSGNRSPATLSQHRTVLRGFYEWLYRQRILSANPALDLELPCQPRPTARARSLLSKSLPCWNLRKPTIPGSSATMPSSNCFTPPECALPSWLQSIIAT